MEPGRMRIRTIVRGALAATAVMAAALTACGEKKEPDLSTVPTVPTTPTVTAPTTPTTPPGPTTPTVPHSQGSKTTP
jgi:hypothetical protein